MHPQLVGFKGRGLFFYPTVDLCARVFLPYHTKRWGLEGEGEGEGETAAVPLRQVAPALRARTPARPGINEPSDWRRHAWLAPLRSAACTTLVKILLFERGGKSVDQRHKLQICYYWQVSQHSQRVSTPRPSGLYHNVSINYVFECSPPPPV
jgi:hypothetical protein